MPIPVQQYQIESFDEANPFIRGMQAGNQWYGDLLKNQEQGMKNKVAPDMLKAELEYKQLLPAHMRSQTGLLDKQVKWYDNDVMSQIDLRKANARRTNIMSDLPFGGMNLPGAAGQVVALEMVKQKYGENSPQYAQAIRQFNLGNDSTQSRIDYQKVLTQTLPTRALTPTGKATIEESRVGEGLAPTGQPWGGAGQGGNANALGNILTQGIGTPAPDSPKNLVGGYKNLRQKDNTDLDTRKRDKFAQNVEKTLARINVDDLTRYSGVAGTFREGLQGVASAFGQESQEYRDYQKSSQNAMLAAKQIRQFYGDSIQPSMAEKLEKLTQPSTWSRSPKLAAELFNETVQLFRSEGETYSDALISTDRYTPESSNADNSDPLGLR